MGYTKKYIDMSYRYTLEPYSPQRKYARCPQCGRQSLTLYIDTETGEYIDDSVGRCRREQNCGYHLPPREFFNLKNNNNMTDIQRVTSSGEAKPEIDHIPEAQLKKFADTNHLPRSQNHKGALQTFLYGIDRERATEVLEEYDVRLTKSYRYGAYYGAVFIQRDIGGKVRNVKEMAYKPDGHRIRDGEDCYVWDRRRRTYVSSREGYDGGDLPTTKLLAKLIMWNYQYVGRQCFFGEHLLNQHLDKPVMVVESEKSALIGAITNPEYLWIATGGKYGCGLYNPEVYKVLKEREVILCPDLGAEEDWQNNAELLAADGIDVSVLCLEDMTNVTEDDRMQGLDIADYLLRAWRLEHPEQPQEEPAPAPTVKRASAPTIAATLSKLPTAEAKPLTLEETYDIDFSDIK
jgi:hypothetical protein